MYLLNKSDKDISVVHFVLGPIKATLRTIYSLILNFRNQQTKISVQTL